MAWSAARLSVLASILVVLAACAAGPQPPSASPSPPVVASPAAPISPDQDFLNRAATGSATEIELGRLAQAQGVAPTVRSFGSHIAGEHARLHSRLLASAQRTGMVPNPATPNVSALAAVSGPEFDRQFIVDQVKNQREALALFQGEAQVGQDPRLRRFAWEWIRILERDLRRAEQIAARIGT